MCNLALLSKLLVISMELLSKSMCVNFVAMLSSRNFKFSNFMYKMQSFVLFGCYIKVKF